MKRNTALLILLSVLLLVLAACGGNGATENGADIEIDAETGLPLNPVDTRSGPFIVEGTLSSLNLTPQTAPEFVVRAPSGQTYRIRSQPLSETFFNDGEPVTPSLIRQGMTVRATAEFDANTQIFISEDLAFIREE
jgi:hypothetical protein